MAPPGPGSALSPSLLCHRFTRTCRTSRNAWTCWPYWAERRQWLCWRTWTKGFKGGLKAATGAKISITGGNFNTNPTSSYVHADYKVTSSNGIYTVVERKYIYLKATHWEVDDARFAAYLWKKNGNTTTDEKWISLTSVGNNIFRGELPDGYDYGCYIIFCRMNPSATANNWNNKWNQTADLKTPTNGNNLFTVTNGAWDDANGTWSKYTSAN